MALICILQVPRRVGAQGLLVDEVFLQMAQRGTPESHSTVQRVVRQGVVLGLLQQHRSHPVGVRYRLYWPLHRGHPLS